MSKTITDDQGWVYKLGKICGQTMLKSEHPDIGSFLQPYSVSEWNDLVQTIIDERMEGDAKSS